MSDVSRVGERATAMSEAEREGLRLQEQLCFAVYSASHAFSRRYKPILRALGLTYPQYLCMLVLWEGDWQTVGAIGDRLQLDSGTLTPLLKRLEAAGLVSRTRDSADERQVRVRLTTAGADLARAAVSVPEQIGCATGQPPDAIAQLRDALLALRDRLNAGNDG